MNHLAPAGEDRWHLPRHAHLVVYDQGGRGLLTIYDCGAAQKPPSAQLLGELAAVDVRAAVEANPTGRVVSLREPGVLERVGDRQYRVVRRERRNRITRQLE